MTNKKITKKTNIMTALEMNPDAADILLDSGLGCIGCAFARAENLEQGLLAHGLNAKQVDEVIEKLNQ